MCARPCQMEKQTPRREFVSISVVSYHRSRGKKKKSSHGLHVLMMHSFFADVVIGSQVRSKILSSCNIPSLHRGPLPLRVRMDTCISSQRNLDAAPAPPALIRMGVQSSLKAIVTASKTSHPACRFCIVLPQRRDIPCPSSES